MLLRAIRPFAQLPVVHQIIVALPPDAAKHPPPWLGEVLGDRLKVTPGGESRSQSVRAALSVLDRECSVVLVHDGARPFVSVETITAVIDTAREGTAAVAAVPVTDTLKRVDAATQVVVETVDRATLWCAQTPQGFPRAMLETAFRTTGGASFTDECALVEAVGCSVRVVRDQTTNIKVTTAQDFALAESLAAT